MKKLAFLLGLFVVTMGLFTTNVVAQDTNADTDVVSYELPAMAILDVEGTAPTLTFAAPSEAGLAVDDVTSALSSINYTSIIATGSTNKVTASITTGAVPTGTTLTVVAGADQAAGDGTVGTAASALTLSGSAQDLVTAIGSCYTGNGFSGGHVLTYTWSVDADAYATVATANASRTVTYTITATI